MATSSTSATRVRDPSPRPSTRARRFLFGMPLVAAVVGVYLIDRARGEAFWSLFLLGGLCAAGLNEFFLMTERSDLKVWKGLAVPLGTALFALKTLSLASGSDWQPAGPVLFLLLFLVSLRHLHGTLRWHYLEEVSITVFGIVYVAYMLTYLSKIALAMPDGLTWLLVVVLTAKSGDIGAYLVGSTLGRRPLIPRVSPGKTVEGAVGGVVTTLAVAWGFDVFLGLGMSLAEVLLFGLVVSFAVQVGDLAESFLKRRFEVKDSSRLIPAFGGVLDLIDSLIFAGPAAFLFLKGFGHIV